MRQATLCVRHGIMLRSVADDNTVKQTQLVEGHKVTAVEEFDRID
ncbi:MAG: hypothetical protein ACREOR_02595 [Candidatus Binatia bacterium]